MPQMAPLWWLMLMLMFIFTLLLFMTILYFNKNFNAKKSMKLTKNQFNWLW